MFSVRTLSASARTLPEAAGAPPEREGPAHVDVGIGADRPARTRVHQVIASTLPFLAASTVTVAEPQTSDPADPASPAKPKAVRVRITRKHIYTYVYLYLSIYLSIYIYIYIYIYI